MLPSHPTELPSHDVSAEYKAAYVQAFTQPWDTADGPLPFGVAESSSPQTLRRKQRQTGQALRLLMIPAEKPVLTFCDLSAGAGHTTFAAAANSRLVFHCDLSIAAVRYASNKATRLGMQNIVAVRADYFRPPFRDSIDRLICLDSLIRGAAHELQALASIRRMLASGGIAVVDFHNWWHNPLRRLGLLPENFAGNRSYSRKQLLDLLRQANIDEFEIAEFVQEADQDRFSGKLMLNVLPATRFMVRFTSAPHSPDARRD